MDMELGRFVFLGIATSNPSLLYGCFSGVVVLRLVRMPRVVSLQEPTRL